MLPNAIPLADIPIGCLPGGVCFGKAFVQQAKGDLTQGLSFLVT